MPEVGRGEQKSGLKADGLLKILEDIKPGKYVTWTFYEGKNILDAKALEDYVIPFFKTGMLMPIPVLDLGLDVISVEADYDNGTGIHKLTLEGRIMKLKKEGNEK